MIAKGTINLDIMYQDEQLYELFMTTENTNTAILLFRADILR